MTLSYDLVVIHSASDNAYSTHMAACVVPGLPFAEALYVCPVCPCSRSFFAACDGIFLNYNWTPLHLNLSRQAAKERYRDVFVGVDVFGRGCPGGGGFNTIEVSASCMDLLV